MSIAGDNIPFHAGDLELKGLFDLRDNPPPDAPLDVTSQAIKLCLITEVEIQAFFMGIVMATDCHAVFLAHEAGSLAAVLLV
jgi:hypothetical protein